MRQSVELAWITAAKMSGGKQRIIFIDDIVFKAPVEIGSVLMLHSQGKSLLSKISEDCLKKFFNPLQFFLQLFIRTIVDFKFAFGLKKGLLKI